MYYNSGDNHPNDYSNVMQYKSKHFKKQSLAEGHKQTSYFRVLFVENTTHTEIQKTEHYTSTTNHVSRSILLLSCI